MREKVKGRVTEMAMQMMLGMAKEIGTVKAKARLMETVRGTATETGMPRVSITHPSRTSPTARAPAPWTTPRVLGLRRRHRGC